MKTSKQGFTLIELLVVVLIIGILAAVALPQYRLAVVKSRATEYKVNLAAVIHAQQLYFLANGKFTRNLTELDIDADPNKYRCELLYTPDRADCWSKPIENGGLRYNFTVSSNSVSYLCAASKDSTIGNKICNAQGIATNIRSNIYNYYRLIN